MGIGDLSSVFPRTKWSVPFNFIFISKLYCTFINSFSNIQDILCSQKIPYQNSASLWSDMWSLEEDWGRFVSTYSQLVLHLPSGMLKTFIVSPILNLLKNSTTKSHCSFCSRTLETIARIFCVALVHWWHCASPQLEWIFLSSSQLNGLFRQKRLKYFLLLYCILLLCLWLFHFNCRNVSPANQNVVLKSWPCCVFWQNKTKSSCQFTSR